MKRLIYKLDDQSCYTELTCGNSSSHNALRLIGFIVPFGIKNTLDGQVSLYEETTLFTHRKTGRLNISFIAAEYDGDGYSLPIMPKSLALLRRRCNKNNLNKAPFLILSEKEAAIVEVTFQQELSESDLALISKDKIVAFNIFALKSVFWIYFAITIIAAYFVKSSVVV